MLKLYDSLSKKNKPFVSLHGNRVYMFVCGITPYDSPHIGHARAYVFYDVLAKYLKYKGYNVFYLQNVTDVDDKIIARALESGVKAGEVSSKYFAEYREVMGKLKVDSVTLYAKSTDYISEIIDLIKKLIKKGYAYPSDGSVYFRVNKFEKFGELSGQIMEKLEEGASIEPDNAKEDQKDFVLWKGYKENEPYWDSPWGRGRPGWHIEDTAIAMCYFREHYDIHGGGVDLIFPHHEAEIAQAEAITDVHPFVNYWMHIGMLNIRGEKMSKSLKNFITIKDLLNKYPPEVVRFFMINNEHLKPLEFSFEAMDTAKVSHEKLVRLKNSLSTVDFDSEFDAELQREMDHAEERFFEAMDNDLSVREGFAAIFTVLPKINKALSDMHGGREQYNNFHDFLNRVNLITDIFPEEDRGYSEAGRIGTLIDSLNQYMEELREKKRYEESDRIRSILEKSNISIEDTKKKTKWNKR